MRYAARLARGHGRDARATGVMGVTPKLRGSWAGRLGYGSPWGGRLGHDVIDIGVHPL